MPTKKIALRILAGLIFLAGLAGALASEAKASPEKTYTDSLGQTFVWIPAGTFVMGTPEDEEGREKDEVQHQVTLTKGYYFQDKEVTVGQWRQFAEATGFKTDAETKGGAIVLIEKDVDKLGRGKVWEQTEGYYWDNPGFPQKDNHPVTCVSWRDVQAYTEWLSKKEGKTYRLPTEAEWEYACRAGTKTRYFWGDEVDCDKAIFGNSWVNECKREDPIHTLPVGSYAPNAWGIYDMHGNVWEWCHDWKVDYPPGPAVDPKGPESGENRVVRGGSWWSFSRWCRCGLRTFNSPDRRLNTLGFRLVIVE
jgi:formylglycine-generating enzyme required for sulfatase activity